jgi:dolichol-phosphate mannosyltransferase
MDETRLSIVIPVKDEQDTVGPLAEEIDRIFAHVDYSWEVVWVDDGSTDDTARRIALLPPPHRLIRLDRNHGQSAALMAGFQAARGTWVGTLDGDGQNDPRDLDRQLAQAISQDVDMVNGVRARRHDNIVRRASSRIANSVRNRLTRETVTDVGCATRVVRRAVLLQLPFFHGMHRFLPTLVKMRGFSVTEMPVNHRKRSGGRSKYGINNRLWAGLRDLFGVRWLLTRQRVWVATEHTRVERAALERLVAEHTLVSRSPHTHADEPAGDREHVDGYVS